MEIKGDIIAKNIVVFSDGTGQEGGKGHKTNIYKMFNLTEDRTKKQISFYDPGLGTGWRKISGNIGGMGISKNIRQCYRFIFENFENGDQIFLFGFSRGAATVRSLSSFIHYFGILPQSRPELINLAYNIYKKFKGEKLKEKADEFVRQNHNMWTRIKYLGCFDTVTALGLPYKTASALLDGIPGFRHKFHNFELSPSVENAYQALAIDDQRRIFHPKLWDEKKEDYQTISQVWFAGMHTDVGGGYKEHALSDISLVWMLENAVIQGLRIYSKHVVKIDENAFGLMHDSRKKWYQKLLFWKAERFWPAKRSDKPIVHESIIIRSENNQKADIPKYNPWILRKRVKKEKWIKYKKNELRKSE